MRLAAMVLKNVTFTLPVDLVERLKEHVKEKENLSLNAAVREALTAYVAELDRQKYRAAMAAAAKDPRFTKDAEDVMAAFAHADRMKETYGE